MTAQEIQKRNERSQKLKLSRSNEGSFYVESSEGMVLYKVNPNGKDDQTSFSCTCGDFARGIKNDPHFQCKHVLSVLNCVPNGEFEDAEFLERKKPKLDERFIITIDDKDFVTYPGLLDLGHQKGTLKIEVEPLQIPTKENENFAVCKALVVSTNWRNYYGTSETPILPTAVQGFPSIF